MRWQSVGTVISVLVALASAVFSGLSVTQANRAANEAAARNDIARRSQRAFLFINRDTLAPFKQGNTVWWVFTPIWENSGNTPPVEGHMFVNYFPAPQALRSGFSACAVGNEQQTPLISVAPRGTSNIAVFNINSLLLKLFQNGQRKKFYIWGWFSYKDAIVGEQHLTRFCWDIRNVIGNPEDPNSQISLPHALCDEGNCFDDDCKESVNGVLKLPSLPQCHMDVMELPPAQ